MKVATATDLLYSLIDEVSRVSNMIRAAKAEGREGLTDAEVDELARIEAEAGQRLRDEIAAARQAG